MKLKPLLFFLTILALAGCSSQPLSTVKEDALHERAMLRSIYDGYHNGELSCEAAMSLVSMQVVSQSSDSIMENTYR